MAIHSSILAWKIPWTEEPGRLQFLGLQRAGYDLMTEQQRLLTHGDLGKFVVPQNLFRYSPFPVMATHSSILAWKIPWTEEPGRLQFMGSQRVGHD